MEISKELLSEVFGREVTNIEKGCTENEFKIGAYFGVARQSFFINIYELENKCKEWAFDRGFAFRIEYLGKKDINIQLINCRNEKIYYSKDFYNIENIEHIIMPCQWILHNKKDENVKKDK